MSARSDGEETNLMNEFLSDHARSVLLPDRRCTATSRSTGERCRKSSALGQFVCDQHGAKSPLSIQAAKERMAILVEPAMEVLYRATRSAPPCETCGRSDADRDPTAVRAAQIILDRTGHHPTLALTTAGPAANPYQDLTDDELIEKLEAMLADARERRDADQRRGLPQLLLLDAFEVPEEGDVRSTLPEDAATEPSSD